MKMLYAINRIKTVLRLLFILMTLSFSYPHAQQSILQIGRAVQLPLKIVDNLETAGSMLDVIDAQTAFVTAEQTLIEALADYKIALVVLDRAVGIENSKEIVE